MNNTAPAPLSASSRRRTANSSGKPLTDILPVAQNTEDSASVGSPGLPPRVEPSPEIRSSPVARKLAPWQEENERIRDLAHRRLDELLIYAERDQMFGEVGVAIKVQSGRFQLIEKRMSGTDKPNGA